MKRYLLGLLVALTVPVLALSGTAMAAPTLTAEGTVLHWTPVTGATEYRVGLSPVSPEKCVELDPCFLQSFPGETTSFDEKGILPGWTYAFKVRKQKPTVGGWSNTVEIYFPEESTAVNAQPTGPSETEWGTEPVYADAFGATIGTGTGQDNTVWRTQKGNHTNSRELQVFRPEEVSVGPEGLTEQCTRHSTAVESGKFYTCGEIKTSTGSGETATGYKLFKWHIAEGATWAFEIVMKYPPNKANEDYGSWSYAYNGGSEAEFDFTESWGYETGNTTTSGYEFTENGTCWLPQEIGEDKCGRIHYAFDPSTAYHRYTTVIYPNNTFSQYIDGELNSKANHVAIVETPHKDWMNLILQYAMAGAGFPEGEHPSLTIRSIAMYEDKAHEGQQIENGGIAPGTTVK
jgi:hypothetical protein